MGPDDTAQASADPLCPTCGGKMSGPISQASLAKSAGFPMAGSATPSSAAPALPQARMTPTLNTGTGTTEIIPGATDIVRSLFSDLIPSAAANQAPTGTKSIINATKVAPPPTGYPDPAQMQSITGMRG